MASGSVPLNTRLSSHDCGICGITYKAISPGCPLCAEKRETTRMREALGLAKNKLEAVTAVSNKNARDADMMHSIRQAALMLNPEDRGFVKAALYQWRDGKAIGALKVVGQPPKGLMAVPREGDAYAHEFTSIGGLALASYYEEATRALGPTDAMNILARALATMLPGGAAAGAS